MSTPVNVHQAKTHFSKLLARVQPERRSSLPKRGDLLTKSCPSNQQKTREPGTAKGKIWIAPDFDESLPEEILKAFEGA